MPLRLSGVVSRDGYPKRIKHLGDHLRVRRLDLGLTQAELAGILGADQASVLNWELGRTTPAKRFREAILAFLEQSSRPLRPTRLSSGRSHVCADVTELA
jgi:transcriptional regulator with XRE-family HTH domain